MRRSCTLILINNKEEMIPRALNETQFTVSLEPTKGTFHFTYDAYGASFIFVVHQMLNKNK